MNYYKKALKLIKEHRKVNNNPTVNGFSIALLLHGIGAEYTFNKKIPDLKSPDDINYFTLPANWKDKLQKEFNLELKVLHVAVTEFNDTVNNTPANKNLKVNTPKITKHITYYNKCIRELFVCKDTGIIFSVECNVRVNTDYINGEAQTPKCETVYNVITNTIYSSLEHSRLANFTADYLNEITQIVFLDESKTDAIDQPMCRKIFIGDSPYTRELPGDYEPLNELNYNDDVVKAYKEVVSLLNDGKSGVIQIHGVPGTGKTSMIRSLIHDVHSKRKCYVMSIAVCEALFNTCDFEHFVSNLISTPCLLIIEDAEALIAKRSAGGNPALTALLQYSDGLDCGNAAILFTYNTPPENVDKALKRPGRALADINIPHLTEEKALALLANLDTKLETPITANTRLTLAEVYAHKPIVTNEKQGSIGFN